MNTFTVFDIETLMYIDEITEFNAEIIASNLVHLNPAILDIIRAQADKNSIPPLLSSEKVKIISDSYKYSSRVSTNRTMIVSPRKRPRVSIVPGLRVATGAHYEISSFNRVNLSLPELSSFVASSTMRRFGL